MNEKDELVDKYKYLKNKIDNYKNLINRSKCPCCEQEIDYKIYEIKIPELELELQDIDKRLDKLIPIVTEENIKKALEEQNKRKKHKIKIDEYIKKNRNILNKAIRDYNKGIKNYLPNVLNEEKPIWNEAMEFNLDNRNMEENEELYFEV